jgi:drug/metabolite transporter (DMT)-like permease
MIYLILSILSVSSLSLILRQGHQKKSNIVLLINANYLAASLLSAIRIYFSDGGFHISTQSFLFAIFLGYLFAATFIVMSKAIKQAGTALATVSSRLSILIPVIFSILFFNEKPSPIMIIGFALTLVTFFFFYISLKVRNGQNNSSNTNKYKYLILVFIGIGLVDLSLKTFDYFFDPKEKPAFVFIIFFSAFIYTLINLLRNKIKFESSTFKLGIILGIVNALAVNFLLLAIKELPAIVVFPVQNVGVIVFTSVMAYLIWKEKINKYGLIAIAIGIFAIILLRI